MDGGVTASYWYARTAITSDRLKTSKMAITQTAQRNHDVLFPKHESTLKITDPELIEIFDNWAFDEVIEDAPLDMRLRLMVQLASLIACQSIAEFRVMLGAALQVGITPVEIKELVYQAVPYAGMAKVFDFLHATNDVFKSRGITLPLDGQSTTTRETRREKGLEVQKRLFGEQIDQMYAQSPKDQLHIQRYLSANCFGDYLTRRGLDLKTRELLTLSMLASLGGCEAQLAGHVKGNLAAGNDRKVLISVVTQLLPFIGYPRALNALRVINEGAPA
jgi:4-carboxymuconolactone decarboxylase